MSHITNHNLITDGIGIESIVWEDYAFRYRRKTFTSTWSWRRNVRNRKRLLEIRKSKTHHYDSSLWLIIQVNYVLQQRLALLKEVNRLQKSLGVSGMTHKLWVIIIIYIIRWCVVYMWDSWSFLFISSSFKMGKISRRNKYSQKKCPR